MIGTMQNSTPKKKDLDEREVLIETLSKSRSGVLP